MRNIAIFLIITGLCGCFLWPSFSDNDEELKGTNPLWEGFKLYSFKLDMEKNAAHFDWIIVNGEGGLADIIAFGEIKIPMSLFSAQSWDETNQYAFREAVHCINSKEEIKPCKTR